MSTKPSHTPASSLLKQTKKSTHSVSKAFCTLANEKQVLLYVSLYFFSGPLNQYLSQG